MCEQEQKIKDVLDQSTHIASGLTITIIIIIFQFRWNGCKKYWYPLITTNFLNFILNLKSYL
jgi:hypothetical protein